MTAARRRGPGYNARIEHEIRRIDRRLELVYCAKRGHWLVVMRVGPGRRAYWNGGWHAGYDVVLRWTGVGGSYGVPTQFQKPGFLPLDMRLVAQVRFGNLANLGHKSRIAQRMFKIDRARLRERDRRRLDRKALAEAFYGGRHDVDRKWSIAGKNPGDVNDYETDDELDRKLSGRARAARLRAKGGRLPMHLREIEREMIERGM